MNEPLLRVDGLVKRFGGLIATGDLTLDVRRERAARRHRSERRGQDHAGAADCGRVDARMREPSISRMTRSARLPAPARIKRGLARTFQITQLLNDYSALDNVALAVQARSGHSFRFWSDARKDRSLRAQAADFLDRVGTAQPRRRCRSANCLTASRSSSSSRSRSQPGRGCCCSTSRWPGWVPPKARI